MGRIMITGALGNVGGFAAQYAIANGEAVTGPDALDYYQVAEILTKTLGRTITYANPAPAFAKQYWLNVRGLAKDYVDVVAMLYMITRMGNARDVTDVYQQVMGRKPHSFAEFAQKNWESWM